MQLTKLGFKICVCVCVLLETNLFAVVEGWCGEAAEDEQRLVVVVHQQCSLLINGPQVLLL